MFERDRSARSDEDDVLGESSRVAEDRAGGEASIGSRGWDRESARLSFSCCCFAVELLEGGVSSGWIGHSVPC